jgi:DNA-directed RNA polymerase specialized sigma24 family protein
MPSPDLGPEWVISSSSPNAGPRPIHNDSENELIIVARRMWPRVQAYALREIKNIDRDETLAIATEVWEGVLRSVAKTIERLNRQGTRINDVEAYLFGAFHHRFNRVLKKERIRQQTIQLLPSNRDLEDLREAQDSRSVADLDRSIQVKEAIQNMDEWTRRVWTARQYGFTWSEIGEFMGLSEHKAKLRFRYAINRLRARFNSGG